MAGGEAFAGQFVVGVLRRCGMKAAAFAQGLIARLEICKVICPEHYGATKQTVTDELPAQRENAGPHHHPEADAVVPAWLASPCRSRHCPPIRLGFAPGRCIAS